MNDIIMMPVGEVKPYPNNPRVNNEAVDKVAASLKAFGWRQPIVVDVNHVIIVGHTRLQAAKRLRMKEVPVLVADDLSEEQVKAYRLADNKTAEFSEWDIDKLEDEISDILNIDMEAFGFDMSELVKDEGVVEDDFDEEPPENPKSKPGDIYQLGKHRLMCGDSTSIEDFDRLMNGQAAVLTVTSPPYGVGKSYEKKGIEAWFETMRPVVENVTSYSKIVCWNLGDLYSTGGQFIEPTSFYSMQMFAENGFKPIWIRIWEKQGMNFGNAPYHLVSNKPVQQYEYISAFAADDGIELDTDTTDYMWLMSFASQGYKFVKRLSRQERREWGYAGIWKINTVKANKEHPAMFPVELPWRCIKMHSDEGNIVLEPFSGSGTTMIACEQSGRICYAMEKDPRYVDLAIRRWESFTGQEAVLLNGSVEED